MADTTGSDSMLDRWVGLWQQAYHHHVGRGSNGKAQSANEGAITAHREYGRVGRGAGASSCEAGSWGWGGEGGGGGRRVRTPAHPRRTLHPILTGAPVTHTPGEVGGGVVVTFERERGVGVCALQTSSTTVNAQPLSAAPPTPSPTCFSANSSILARRTSSICMDSRPCVAQDGGV